MLQLMTYKGKATNYVSNKPHHCLFIILSISKVNVYCNVALGSPFPRDLDAGNLCYIRGRHTFSRSKFPE